MNFYSFIFIMIIVIKHKTKKNFFVQASVFCARNNQHDNLDVENLCPIIFHQKKTHNNTIGEVKA